MSDAVTIIKRALNICGAHSEVNPANPELLSIGREQLVALLGELAVDEVFVGAKVASVTSVGLVATVTLVDHGFTAGDTVLISGANQAAYNGEFEITADAADTFEFALTDEADSPATGTIRAVVYPDEEGDQVGEDRGATTDLQYALALQMEAIGRTAIKPEHRMRADQARPKLESRFCVPTIPRLIPSRLLPRGQGSSRGTQPSTFMAGEALDDDSAT